jgi:hypothetical protein
MDGSEKSQNGLPIFESEQQFQNYLEEKFESAGFTAIQEVSPHHSQYRADMILLHDEFGPIGLELKLLSGGSDAGKAHQQIVRQYAGKKYIGHRVEKWAFAPYMPKLQDAENRKERDRAFQVGKLEVLEHFFHRYGIGTLNVHSRPYARLKWGSKKEFMLPAFPMKREIPERNRKGYNLELIDERIDSRLYQR